MTPSEAMKVKLKRQNLSFWILVATPYEVNKFTKLSYSRIKNMYFFSIDHEWIGNNSVKINFIPERANIDVINLELSAPIINMKNAVVSFSRLGKKIGFL